MPEVKMGKGRMEQGPHGKAAVPGAGGHPNVCWSYWASATGRDPSSTGRRAAWVNQVVGGDPGLSDAFMQQLSELSAHSLSKQWLLIVTIVMSTVQITRTAMDSEACADDDLDNEDDDPQLLSLRLRDEDDEEDDDGDDDLFFSNCLSTQRVCICIPL